MVQNNIKTESFQYIAIFRKNKHYLVTPWFYYHRKKRRNETGVSTETVQEEHHKSKVEVPVAKDEGITKKAQIVSEEPK